MKASEIKKLLQEAYAQRSPKFIILGSPGCGKTSICYQLADEVLKVPRFTFQATLYDPVEIKGLPVFDHQTGKARFLPFEDMPSMEEGILVIDDLPHAPQQTQNAFMRLVLEGVAGSWNLGGLYPVCTGNRAMDRAGAKDLQTAMANRFVFVDFTVDYEEWRKWAITKNIVPEVISFLGSPYGRDWLDKFDPSRQINPTPRSWEFASQLWKVCPKGILREALSGCIGEEAAAKFLGYLRVYDRLPDLKEIVAGKNLVVDDLDIMYAVISGLVSIAASFEKKKTIIERLLDYSMSLPDGFVELSVWLAKDLYQLDPTAFAMAGNLSKWREKFEDVIF